MKLAFLIAGFLLASLASTSNAQTPRFATLEINPVRVTNVTVTWSGSNSIAIAAGETVEIVSFLTKSVVEDPAGQLVLHRQGMDFDLSYLSEFYRPYRPTFFQGPAELHLTTPSDYPTGTNSPTPTAFVTLRIHPDAFPPDRTLVIGPGTNQVGVALECSSNLVDWSPATNGVYGGSDTAKFFRIKAQRGP